MITMTFSGQSYAEINEQMRECLVGHQQYAEAVDNRLQEINAVLQQNAAPAADAPAKRGPGRPRKADATAAPEVPGQTAIPGPPMEVTVPMDPGVAAPPQAAPASSPTLDDVKTAVKKLTEFRPKVDKNTQDSIRRAVPVLQQFGATTIKELKPEQYANFIEACRKA